MPPKTPVFTPGMKRLMLWMLLGFGVALLVMVVLKMKRQKADVAKATAKTPPPGTKGNAGTLPTNFPKDPVDKDKVNQDYVNGIAWKMNDVATKGADGYKCEVTNGIITMGDDDLRALVMTYQSWYKRALADDYCGKLNNSGCGSLLGDGKYTKACERLKKI